MTGRFYSNGPLVKWRAACGGVGVERRACVGVDCRVAGRLWSDGPFVKLHGFVDFFSV